MIGTFGNIVFETSSDKVLTLDGFSRRGSASFAEHPVLDNKAVLQHVGEGLDEISFSIRLDVEGKVNPKNHIEMLRTIKSSGDAKKLIIGSYVLGDFVITEIGDSWHRIDNKGIIYGAVVNISLKECANGN